MTGKPFTFSVIRYVHDPIAAESVNIGVVLFSAVGPYLGLKVDHRTEHLAHVFAGFSTQHYLPFLSEMEESVRRLQRHWDRRPLAATAETASDVAAFTGKLCPDQGLSIQFTPPHGGITTDHQAELDALFNRYVVSQHVRRKDRARRDDKEVWASVYQSRLPPAARSVLQPMVLATPEVEIEFPHAYKNAKWHVFQTLSFDYVDPETIQSKAARWLGNGVALAEHPDLASMYLLLGRPQQDRLLPHYEKAKALLLKMPRRPVLVDEQEAEAFSVRLVGDLRKHRLIPAE